MQYTRPALTIAIPTVNRADLVCRAVESALAQTRADIEVIVSDNGSTDGTPGLLSRLRDRRLRHYRHERTMPASTHGKFLIDQAQGEFFVALSDDDYLEPEFSARVLELVERQAGLAFVYTKTTVHIDGVSVHTLAGPDVEPGADFLAAYFAWKREVRWCATASRLEHLRRIGEAPPEWVIGDMFYLVKLATLGDVGCVPLPLSNYTYLAGDNSSSRTPVARWAQELRILADEAMREYVDTGVDAAAISSFRREADKFVARSTANQFLFNAIRGVEKGTLIRAFSDSWSLLGVDASSMARAAAAIALPSTALKWLILLAMRRRVASRRNST
jgi:hypothetical protein